jgi:DEAD/DEAH box helicase domain-containing protein
MFMVDLQSVLTTLSDRLTVQHAPLLAFEQSALQYGNRISHLPVEPRLVEAWLRVTSSPFFHPHAVALSSLRRGEHFALFGPSGVTADCLHLMALERLSAQPGSTVLLLAPDQAAVNRHDRSLRALSKAMDPGPPIAALGPTPDRGLARARLLSMTPHDLDQRLLQHSARGLRSFIERLDLILITDLQRHAGVAALHLQHLLQRLERLGGRTDLQYGLNAVDVSLPGDALTRLAPGNWRSITLDEGPRAAQARAVWQLPDDRHDELVTLATTLAAAIPDDSLHLVAHPAEVDALRSRLQPIRNVSVAADVRAARVLLLAAGDLGARRIAEAVASEAELVLLAIGDHAVEQITATALLPSQHTPALQRRPAWFSPAANSYVTARHLVCSAAERPLTAGEITTWQLEGFVQQLVQHEALRPLPGDGSALVPSAAVDPYHGFDLQVPAGPAVRLAGGLTADPAALDRWYFAGAALPPLRGGLTVNGREETSLQLTTVAETSGRRTLPLRRCRVTVREQRNERSLAPLHRLRLSIGRVLVTEDLVGFAAGHRQSAAVTPLNDQPSLTWLSSALWIELPLQRSVIDQQIGWSLAAALPLFSCATLTDLVPLYDETSQRLYLVDAQPAGSGLIEWLYTEFESLLPTAFRIALDWQDDALLRECAAADLEWLSIALEQRYADTRQLVTQRTAVQTAALEAVPVAVGVARAALRDSTAASAAPPPAPPQRRRSADIGEEAPAANRPTPRRSTLLPAGLVPAGLMPPATPPAGTAAAATTTQTQSGAARRTPRQAPERREFHIGDRVACSPYGNGVVKAITFDGSRRLLTVDFGDFGALPIDPALSPLRLLGRAARKVQSLNS